jgi:hypothetical protein
MKKKYIRFITYKIQTNNMTLACTIKLTRAIFTVVKELRSKMLGQHPGYCKAVFLKKTQIIIVSICDISVDCSDFDAGFLITYRKI